MNMSEYFPPDPSHLHGKSPALFTNLEKDKRPNPTIGKTPSSQGLPPRVPRGEIGQRPATGKKMYKTPGPFASVDRAALRRQNNEANENKTTTPRSLFHAKPVNRRLLESPTVGVKKEKPRSPTRTMEFSFKTRDRAVARSKLMSRKEVANDLTKCFKALPMPSDNNGPSAPKKSASTVSQPFKFETDRIDKEHKEKQRQKQQQEEEQRRKAMEFRAKAMPDFKRAVFCPAFGGRRTTEVEPLKFQTSHRALERKNFDTYVKAKEDELNEAKRRRELERKQREEEEVRRLRDSMVHRAQPLKRTKPFEVKHNLGQVTVPCTPKFQADLRLIHRPPSGAHL